MKDLPKETWGEAFVPRCAPAWAWEVLDEAIVAMMEAMEASQLHAARHMIKKAQRMVFSMPDKRGK